MKHQMNGRRWLDGSWCWLKHNKIRFSAAQVNGKRWQHKDHAAQTPCKHQQAFSGHFVSFPCTRPVSKTNTIMVSRRSGQDFSVILTRHTQSWTVTAWADKKAMGMICKQCTARPTGSNKAATTTTTTYMVQANLNTS